MQSAGTGNGLEALRLLGKRYDPKNPGTKRALLKSLMTTPSCSKITDLEKTIMKVEELVKKYESMAGPKGTLPDDLVATIMINVCHKELRDHMELSTTGYTRQDVRTEIFSYIERKRTKINEELVAMEVDSVETEKNWECDYGWNCYVCDNYEELNFFGKGKGGKFGGKGNYGKNNFFSGKGMGKNMYQGGKGPWYGGGKYNGKGQDGGKAEDGKGKGKNNIICFWCNRPGHTQAMCREKDTYMQGIRDRNNAGGGDKELNSCNEGDHWHGLPKEKEKGSELANMEASARSGQTYRYLSSFEGHNAFSALQVTDANFPEVPGGPPGLQPGKYTPKMPQWRKKSVKNASMVRELSLLQKSNDKELNMVMKKTEIIKEVMNMENNEEYIEATIDSGASDSVAGRKHAKTCDVVPSSGSRDGVKYVSASGDIIDNIGEKHVQVETATGRKRTLNLQVADVHRVLLSVSKICDAGNQVIFTRSGGKIVNDKTGEEDHFARKDRVYRMRLKVIGDGSKTSGFAGPGK